MAGVEYEWGPAKDAANRRKHGLSLADGIPAMEDPNALVDIGDTLDYGEERFVTLGLNAERVQVVVWAERSEDAIRIISVRKAERHERRRYYQD